MVKLQVLGNNSKPVNKNRNLTWDKNDQHSNIYQPCNFEVNLITHLGVIALFSYNYLTLRSKVKVPQRSLWYVIHRLMVMHPHTKYH
jgi:hypothetical protein